MRSNQYYRKILAALVVALVLSAAFAAGETPRAKELFKTGKLAFGSHNYAVAEGNFRQLLENFPEYPDAAESYLLLGEALYYQERWADAAATLEEGRKKFPQKFADAFLFWQAEAQSRGGHYADALPLYREVVEKFPARSYRAQAQFGIGDTLFRTGQLDEAKSAFLALQRQAANAELEAEAMIGLGKVNLATNAVAAAEENFREVIARYSQKQSVWLAHYWLAECRLRQKDFEGALKELKLIAEAKQKVRPNSLPAQSWFAMGQVHLEQNEFALAAADFERATAQATAPELRAISSLQQAEALFRAGQTASAIEQLRAFQPPSAPILFRIAELLYTQQKYKDALDAYRDVLTKFPQSELVGKSHFGAAWSLHELRRDSESVDEFAQASQLGPDPELKAQAQFKIGDIYFAQQQFPRAVAAYQAVLDLFSGTSVADRAQFQIGVAQTEAGDFAAAASAWETLVKKFGGSAYADRAQFQFGWARYNLRQFPEARRAFEMLLNNFPDSPLRGEAWLTIAQIWQAEGHIAEALSQYEAFAPKFPNHPLQPRADYEHALCEEKIGNLPRVREEMLKLTETYATHPLAASALFWLAKDLFSEKEFVKAREAFQQMAQKFHDDELAPHALLWAGRATLSYGQRDQARALFDELIKKYPQYLLLCAEARFLQADSFTDDGNFGGALGVFADMIRSYPTSPLVGAAWGRKGDCFLTLKNYDEAKIAYDKALTSDKADLTLRNQAEYGIAVCEEQLGKPEEACKRFANVVYRTLASDGVRESFWFSGAAQNAARIKENQKLWADAVTFWELLAKANVHASAEAKARAEQIRKEHPEEF